jgi:hypothetical protein
MYFSTASRMIQEAVGITKTPFGREIAIILEASPFLNGFLVLDS